MEQEIIFANRYRLIKRLGSGAFSVVWLAGDYMANSLQMAVKIFAPDKGLDPDVMKSFRNEYALVFGLNHPHLLKPSHFDIFQSSPYLIMQYFERGSAEKLIGTLSEAEIAKFLFQSADALAYLHRQSTPIIHQDIKPDNFIIDNDGNYLLTDFGISGEMRNTLRKSLGVSGSVGVGTPAYMPPEKTSKKMEERKLSPQADIWSLGITAFELATGEWAFSELGGIAQKTGAELPELPNNFSRELQDLLYRMFALEIADRPTAREIAQEAKSFLETGHWQRISATPPPIPKEERAIPSPIPELFNEAENLFGQGQYFKAQEKYQKILEFDPNHQLAKTKIETCKEKRQTKPQEYFDKATPPPIPTYTTFDSEKPLPQVSKPFDKERYRLPAIIASILLGLFVIWFFIPKGGSEEAEELTLEVEVANQLKDCNIDEASMDTTARDFFCPSDISFSKKYEQYLKENPSGEYTGQVKKRLFLVYQHQGYELLDKGTELEGKGEAYYKEALVIYQEAQKIVANLSERDDPFSSMEEEMPIENSASDTIAGYIPYTGTNNNEPYIKVACNNKVADLKQKIQTLVAGYKNDASLMSSDFGECDKSVVEYYRRILELTDDSDIKQKMDKCNSK